MASRLPPPDLECVDSFFRQDISIPEIADLTVATISPPTRSCLTASTKIFHELKMAQPFSAELMAIVWKMFEKRECRIASAHKEVNEGKQHYSPYKRSCFVSGNFISALENDPESNNILDAYFPTG